MADPQTYRARYVFPVASPPIAGGCVTVAEGRILSVGPHPAAGPVEDLGNVALLPGLINAHTHLELSDLPAPLGQPGMPLVGWLKQVVDYRRERPAGGRHPVERGLEESLRYGVTTLGEIAQPDWPADALTRYPGDAAIFLELIAPLALRVAPTVERAHEHLVREDLADNVRPGLSPHAPHTVHPELLRTSIELSRTRRCPIAFHLAESREELQLLHRGSGPFRDLLLRLEAWDPRIFPGGLRPLDYLVHLARADRVLVIHGNYLADDEIAFLARNADRMSVVYCPRTHAYFGHTPHPLRRMLDAGVSVALGTDSRASSPDLDLLAEVRHVARHYPQIPSATVLELATVRAARALGLPDPVGTLSPGAPATFIAVPLAAEDLPDPHALLYATDVPASAVWCRGVRQRLSCDEATR